MAKQVIKMMYRVEYKYLNTNFTSHGDWFESKDLVKAWVDYANKEYKGLVYHWIGKSLDK
jgi:hypothetical protein